MAFFGGSDDKKDDSVTLDGAGMADNMAVGAKLDDSFATPSINANDLLGSLDADTSATDSANDFGGASLAGTGLSDDTTDFSSATLGSTDDLSGGSLGGTITPTDTTPPADDFSTMGSGFAPPAAGVVPTIEESLPVAGSNLATIPMTEDLGLAKEKPESTPLSLPGVSIPETNDPEKKSFVKTYTASFDSTVRRATTAADKVLDAIDRAVHEHSADIAIPKEANEFLDNAPKDGKVQKFDDARQIVRTLMATAETAQAQSAQAAAEAAKIYDGVQVFKKETRDQIAKLRVNMPDDDDSMLDKKDDKVSKDDKPNLTITSFRDKKSDDSKHDDEQ